MEDAKRWFVILFSEGKFKIQKHDFHRLAIRILDGNNRFRFLTLSGSIRDRTDVLCVAVTERGNSS